MPEKKPLILIILDGCGLNPEEKGNAITLGNTPFLDSLLEEYPHTQLTVHGGAVGLPEGIMGNSEVGHLNIGAGRVVYQDLLRIDMAIADRSFFDNQALNAVMAKVKDKGTALHLMGLVSDGGVHSQLTHLFALLEMTKNSGLKKVYIHAILDGRDTPPNGGECYVMELQDYIKENNSGKIATICGRFYAMDRDTRWERNKEAYDLFVLGKGVSEKDPVQAVKNAYNRGETDEFIRPIVIMDESDKPMWMVEDEDGIVFFNFRADRARQITRALTESDFKMFERDRFPKVCEFVTMTMYDEEFALPIAFPPEHMEAILGEVISKKGLRQLRIAETEKYAHVTYFFNGGEEEPFPLEDRCLIPSPREVSTYDQKPEMSALKVAEETVVRLQTGDYDFIVLNFANMDMVGHTGIQDAAIRAVETVDTCVKEVVKQVQKQGGKAFITADHGNAEQMIDNNGNPHTAHTLNPVFFIMVDDSRKDVTLSQGCLGDIAPTILDILGIDKPEKMTGKSLLEE